MDHQLERLERIADLRTIWKSEEKNFTPWLAKNLELLEETLGVKLELEATEKTVGPFRADIFCRETDPDGRNVLVENQLEPTNHTHLGQLLTYAAGLEAVTIVWIAAPIRDEHRTALDWLNRITDENFQFFGLEIELWRIGDSALAPKLNIISKPDNWSKSFPKATIALSDTQRMQVDYWAAFQDVLDKAGGSVSARPTPQPQNWMGYGVGSGDCGVDAVMNTRENRVQVRLRI